MNREDYDYPDDWETFNLGPEEGDFYEIPAEGEPPHDSYAYDCNVCGSDRHPTGEHA